MGQWSALLPAPIIGPMVKQSSRRGAASKVRRANEARPAKSRGRRKRKVVEPGPYVPLRIWYFFDRHPDPKFTLEELASRMKMSTEYVSQLANGRKRWDQEILDAAAHALGVTRDQLIPREEGDPVGEFTLLSREEQVRAVALYRTASEQFRPS